MSPRPAHQWLAVLITSVFLMAPVTTPIYAQAIESIHAREQSDHRGDTNHIGRSEPLRSARSRPPEVSRRVFGWLPYWIPSTSYTSLDLGALTTVGYFSAEVNPTTGGLQALHDWPLPGLRDAVRGAGVGYVLTVTSFGYEANDMLLGDELRRHTLVQAIVAAVAAGEGTGVNIDFESVRASQRQNLVTFMRELADELRSAIGTAEISMAVPAVDWSGAFDATELAANCDYLIVMGYDFHWSSAPSAGPVAPLAGESYNVARSIQTWLESGVPAEKLQLGVPWYGYDWPVVDSTRGSATTGRGVALRYEDAVDVAEVYGRMWDEATSTPWYRYSIDSAWRQAWYDDSASLGLKYALVNERELGGIGIWALGYQGTREELWTGIRQAFALSTDVRPQSSGGVLMSVRGSHLIVTGLKGPVTVVASDAIGRGYLLARNVEPAAGGLLRLDLRQRGLIRGAYVVRVVSRGIERTRRLILD